MTTTQRILRYGQRRLLRKMLRTVPYLGGLVAVATLGSAMRRKGAVRGAVHTVLDMIPYVGGAKIVAETVRGRDFFPDKAGTRYQASGTRTGITRI
jgi:hypothetical protein